MIAFAKDITQTDPRHPEEANNAQLRQYMDYQRKINHEKLIYHALDHAKTYLQKNINDFRGDAAKLAPYIRQAFPSSSRFADHDLLMLMLRKLINAHNATNNWYRLNAFYFSVVYDALERFVKIYNRLVRETPDKAAEYGIAEGVEIDFDDWVRLYFHDLDFLLGQEPRYVHFTFRRRNQEIERFIEQETQAGLSRDEALDKARKDFQMDPSAIKILKGETLDQKDLELFYTSVENPIYETLYDPHSPDGLMDGEPPIDHDYFMAFQFRGLSAEEAEALLKEADQISKN